MKTRIITLILVSFFYCLSASGQNAIRQADLVGNWKFEAPYAPDGYSSGSIVVAVADDNYNTTMSFTGSEYKIKGEKVKVEKDIFSFTVYLEGEAINITLKSENAARMTGKAVYSGGEVPLTVTKLAAAR